MARKLKPSKFIYDRIKTLGYVQPEEEGYVKAQPSHLSFRYGLYKLIGLAFYTHFVWMIASSI